MRDARIDALGALGLSVRRLSSAPAALGESPVWDPASGVLWWIDGVAGVLHGIRPDGGGAAIQSQVIGGHLGCIALATDERLIVARDHEVALCDPATGATEPFLVLKDADARMRLNDGKLDRQGRFLCAGMGRGREPLGGLHQIDGTGRHHMLAGGIRVGNGVCFSPQGDILYFTDTPTCAVMAADYDPETGAAGVPRRHIDTAGLEAGIDGATVDAAGNLWAALITIGEIGCFAPDGRLVQRIPAPVDLPSSLAFGGSARATLFVTSIRDSGTGRAVSSHADGGHLFALDGLGATGLPEARFAPGTHLKRIAL
ncbi:SMP-30/gluconolactonase/LRE family protein [Mesorhizobium xinjiangense]|uniref:SMP-30/gluconolactonase/LRE family protein n=1 Tax=Mesorhizobium xinjiangense TaxID=2678685 RepID=UPI0012EECE4D|nr:SMP-30/gluconolactonase/LRE family protein [Mesorhizobium xinjiangense]